MTSAFDPIPPQDLSGILGYRYIYTYANGWQYELYAKNQKAIDYRIHSGHVGGRWVKDQTVDLFQLADDSYRCASKTIISTKCSPTATMDPPTPSLKSPNSPTSPSTNTSVSTTTPSSPSHPRTCPPDGRTEQPTRNPPVISCTK
jgi:Phenolic acid decarboxylase (PAD)